MFARLPVHRFRRPCSQARNSRVHASSARIVLGVTKTSRICRAFFCVFCLVFLVCKMVSLAIFFQQSTRVDCDGGGRSERKAEGRAMRGPLFRPQTVCAQRSGQSPRLQGTPEARRLTGTRKRRATRPSPLSRRVVFSRLPSVPDRTPWKGRVHPRDVAQALAPVPAGQAPVRLLTRHRGARPGQREGS